MRLFALISTIALASALNQREVDIIDIYGQKYGFDGACYTLQVKDNGNSYQIESTGIPNHPVYTTNPNDVQEQAYSYSIPKNPSIASSQSCVPMGEIGFALNGVPFYNPLSGPDSNAVQGTGAETFDGCGGHPAMMGKYHYHELPSLDCIFHDNVLSDDGNGTLIGVALDGFPIYYWKEAADLPEFEELLDECHGTSKLGGTYRYYITKTFPYILGCFKGAVSSNRIVSCPSFNGEEKALCSCPMGQRPPARRQLQQSSASILRFDDITDSECRYQYDCDEPLSTHLWCHTTEMRPANCDISQDQPCPAKNNAQIGQPAQPGTSQQQQPPQYGQQQPPQQGTSQQQPPQQGTSQQQQPPQYGQQQPPQYGQQQPPQQGTSQQQQPPQYGQQQPPQYGQQQPPQQGTSQQQQPPQYGQQQRPQQGTSQQQQPPQYEQQQPPQQGTSQQQQPPQYGQLQRPQQGTSQQQQPPQYGQQQPPQYGQQQPPQYGQQQPPQYGQQQPPQYGQQQPPQYGQQQPPQQGTSQQQQRPQYGQLPPQQQQPSQQGPSQQQSRPGPPQRGGPRARRLRTLTRLMSLLQGHLSK